VWRTVYRGSRTSVSGSTNVRDDDIFHSNDEVLLWPNGGRARLSA
jgi:hypothetical protein